MLLTIIAVNTAFSVARLQVDLSILLDLFHLIFYFPVNNSSVMSGQVYLG